MSTDNKELSDVHSDCGASEPYALQVTDNSMEPCPMCAQAISFARIKNLHFAAEDKKSGGVLNGPKIFESSSCHHKPEIYSGMMAEESSELLKRFFKSKR